MIIFADDTENIIDNSTGREEMLFDLEIYNDNKLKASLNLELDQT